jgi:ferredoxin
VEEVSIFVMGKEYKVPKNTTILRALEYAGFFLIRGVGCRGGFCGACGVVYRTPDSYRLKVGLACQNMVEEGMALALLPYYPQNKKRYEIEKVSPAKDILLSVYPETLRCISCGSCTKVCPQGIRVADCVNLALRGDLALLAELSFDCIMCGLCASRCPAEIPQPYLFLLARRLHGAKEKKRSCELKERVKEIRDGKFSEEIRNLKNLSLSELKELYAKRPIED